MTEPTPTVPARDLTPQDITNLVDELRDYHAIYSPLFQRREQRAWALTYLHGLLLDLERTSVEPMAIALHGPYEKHVRALPSFINAGPWDDDAILRQHGQEVNTTLGDDDGAYGWSGACHYCRSGFLAQPTTIPHRKTQITSSVVMKWGTVPYIRMFQQCVKTWRTHK
jgi:hypothetical protein